MSFIDRAIRAGYYLMTDKSDAAAHRCKWQWINSLRRPDPLRYARPWITFGAIEWAEATLRPDMTVFEWGSGGSTIFWAQRTRSVLAVEHDQQWVERVNRALDERGLSHAQCVHVATPELPPSDENAHAAWVGEFYGKLLDCRAYAAAIDDIADHSLDLVVIDGAGRCECARHALAKVRPGGYIMLDNSDRQRYDPIRDLYDGYPCEVFGGAMPYRNRRSETTVWTITAPPASTQPS